MDNNADNPCIDLLFIAIAFSMNIWCVFLFKEYEMAKILVAEDDTSMRNFLTMALTKAGHEVTACENGLEALAVLEDNKDHNVLLADIVMPGMDGIELSQRATDLCPDLKVMYITGFSAVALGNQSLEKEQETTKVLSKPFHLKDLVDQVEMLLAA